MTVALTRALRQGGRLTFLRKLPAFRVYHR